MGQFSYVLDCFSTSTDEERNLFDTDSAMNADHEDYGLFFDEEQLDALWPETDPALV